MKNIIKNLILVFILLVGILGISNLTFAAAPSVITLSADATENSITFKGGFVASGILPTETMFEYSTVESDLNLQPGNGTIVGNYSQSASSGSFNYTISATPGVMYYFRAIATNAGGTAYGYIDSKQTTSMGPSCPNGPTISSLSPSSTTVNSAINVVISGTNLSASTIVTFNGASKANTFNNPNITISLLTSDVNTVGGKTITVSDGAGCSDSRTFTVTSTTGGGHNGGGGGSGTTYPYVFTISSSNVADDSATLNGAIDPREHSTWAWFEYSTTSTFETHVDTTHIDMGSEDERSDLTQNISGLTPNTIYFFRASAENQHGTKKGDIMSFKTLKETSTGIITTIQATNQLSTSAKLNGIFVNQTGGSVQGYFEYGKTSNLSSTTSTVSLGSGETLSFSKTVTGLTSDTIYYFRAMAKKGGETYTGKTLVFKTKAIIIPVEPSTTETTPEEVIETEETNIESTIFTIVTKEDATEVGKEIEYTITFENNSEKNFENTVISVQLPDAVDFLASDSGIQNENNIITFNVGTLIPSQTGTMKIIGKVNSKATDLGVLVTTAIMSYTPVGSEFPKDEIAYVTNTVNPTNDLGAASIWGNKSFLPSSIIGWLAILLVVLGFIIVGKNLYAAYAYKKNQNQYGEDLDVNLENIDIDNLPR